MDLEPHPTRRDAPKRDSIRPGWMRTTLVAAAIYNLAWGAWVVLRPTDLFDWTGIQPPRYLGIWQCVGMIVGVYGIGYAIASRDPLRHWPITLVGLLGKILGPIGFLFMKITVAPGDPGHLPWSWGITILSNDLIWWVPFGAILYQAWKISIGPTESPPCSVTEANDCFADQYGQSLAERSRGRSLMLIFLRHSGCTFCREALADLKTRRTDLQTRGIQPVLVHQGDPARAEGYFAGYGLADVPRVSDPGCVLYRAYDLQRGGMSQLFGPGVWWPGFRAAILNRHGVGKLDGDGFQMPGIFIVRDNQVIHAYRHATAADRPDVCQIAAAADQGTEPVEAREPTSTRRSG